MNTYAEHLLSEITRDTRDEEVTIHVTILAFGITWKNMIARWMLKGG